MGENSSTKKLSGVGCTIREGLNVMKVVFVSHSPRNALFVLVISTNAYGQADSVLRNSSVIMTVGDTDPQTGRFRSSGG